MTEQDQSTKSLPATCRVFISYSHDSTEHEQRVLALAHRLRANGIEAWIDQYVQDPEEGWIKWMRTQVKEAKKVLLVFTETYQKRFEGDEEEGKGLGATFEGVIVTQALYEHGGRNAKFRPVIFCAEDTQFISDELMRFSYYRVDTEENYTKLLRWLHRAPLIVPPEVSQKPDLPAQPISELFPIKANEPPVSALGSLPGGAQGAAVRQPAFAAISKTVEIAEGLLSLDTISWRTSVLLTPPFLDKPEITLIRESGGSAKDPVVESVTADKLTVKISSGDQAGRWIWRARGRLLKSESVDTASGITIEIAEGLLNLDTISWRTSVLLTPPFLDKPRITLVRENGGSAKDPVVESVTADKFTVKISSGDQAGRWIWRARGPRRDEKG